MASKNDPATAYARRVVAGKVVAGKYLRLACQRHMDDLDAGHERGLCFEPKAAEIACDFFRQLKHSKGREWAGKVFELSNWQQFVVGSIFGWKRQNGTRRFRVAHLEVARKNGKTTLASGIGLYLLLLDGEPGAEVYTVATKRDQARLTHEESKRMVKASTALAKRVSAYKDNLHVPLTNSKYEPLGANEDKLDGLNVSGAICDELHAWRQRRLWDVIETATGARSQPLLFCTTTAGFDRHSIWWERRELCLKVLTGIVTDDELFAAIYTLDEKDDWKDEANWPKSNPNLGVTVQLMDLRKACHDAEVTPGKQNPFKRLKLNMPTEQASRWLSLEQWDLCAGECSVAELYSSLLGRRCYGALDLSSTTDLTALVLLFPSEREPLTALFFFWIPAETAQRRALEDSVDYPLWIDDGVMEETEGSAVDYSVIREKLHELAASFVILGLAMDPWNAQQLATELKGDGFEVVAIRQGFASLSAPSKELERLIVCRGIRHGGHPVQRWCVANVAVEQDAAGNLKPSKAKSTGRIDGVVALVMAVGLAATTGQNQTPSISWI